MNLCLSFSLFTAVLGASVALAAEPQHVPKEITRGERYSVPLTAVQINDPFWSPKLKVYREKTILHSWKYVQKEIEDNEIAAGWRHDKRGKDTPWNQANLHKVLETCAYALAQEPNAELDKKFDYIISALAAAQQPNGYCNALITVRNMTPWANLDGQHDGYVAGHLIEAAVAHYQATGKTNFLHVATRFADHIYDHFITQKHEGVCGHAGLELALARLYRVTGERRYLELAKDWIERRGKPWAYTTETERSYFMDHLPIRKVTEITGHAVRSMFYVTGVADIGHETGDKGLKSAARRLWDNTTLRKMYVTGSVGSNEKDEGFEGDYVIPNSPGYNESCASCGVGYFAHAMFRMDGKSESADVLERALYNAILHGISLDGTNTYYRNPLTDENRPRNNVWVCCPPCLSRTLLRLPDYVYAQTDDSIYVNLYVGGTVDVNLKNKKVKLIQTGDYVREGRVEIKFDLPEPTRFELKLREPGWADRVVVKVNNEEINKSSSRDGYLGLKRRWTNNDVVNLEFPMEVQRIVSHPNVEGNRGLVALQRGPLVYGVEGVDNGGRVDFTLPATSQFSATYRPELLGGVVTLQTSAADGKPLVAVPFYSMANRGNSKQVVWLKQESLQTPQLSREWNQKLYRSLDVDSN